MKIRSIFSTVLSGAVAAPFAAWGVGAAGAEPHPSPGAGTVASTSPSAPQVVPGAEPTTTVPGNASSTPPTPTPSSSEPSASSPATSSSTTSSPPTPTPTEPTSTSPTPAPIPVGPHVATATGIGALGKPTSTEQRWYRAGGGYAQHFERGLALIAVDASGRPIPTMGGVVLDGFAEYYKAHPNTGWPVSPQMSDAKGLWQRFDSPNHAYRGALMRASASAPIHGVESRVYDYYVSNPAVR